MQYGMVRSLSIEVSHIIATNLRGTKARKRAARGNRPVRAGWAKKCCLLTASDAEPAFRPLPLRSNACEACCAVAGLGRFWPADSHLSQAVVPSSLIYFLFLFFLPGNGLQGAKTAEEVEEAAEQNKRAREEIIRRAPRSSLNPQRLHSPPWPSHTPLPCHPPFSSLGIPLSRHLTPACCAPASAHPSPNPLRYMNFAHLLLLTDAQQSEKGDFADSPQRKVCSQL